MALVVGALTIIMIKEFICIFCNFTSIIRNHMKTIFPILTCVVIFLAGQVFSQSHVIYVDAGNNTGTEDGTAQHPFNTIKEGINAATAGDTVAVMQGTYTPDDSWSGNNHTLFLKPGVKIIGESRDNTIIDGIIVDQETSNLASGVENVAFGEYHFIRAASEGPFTESNIIRNCSVSLIRLAHASGIPVNDTTPGPNHSFLIDNNVMENDGIIEFSNGDGAAEMIVFNNQCGYIELKCGSGYIFEIKYNDVQYGIIDHSGANYTEIAENLVHDGAIIDKSQGNPFEWGSDQRIEYNIITCNEDSPVFEDESYKAGIIDNSASVYIGLNTIYCSGDVSGIVVYSGTPTHIISNTIYLDEVQNPGEEENSIGIYNRAGQGQVSWNIIYGGIIGYLSSAASKEFSYNEVKYAGTGFISNGAERVFANKIEDCYGDGMILTGLKGPVYNNWIMNNDGAGIRILDANIDLGGGADTCPGMNVIQGNGNYDLFIQDNTGQSDTLFAKHNVWDHTDQAEVMEYDIHDGSDSTGLAVVEFLPVSQLGIGEEETGGQGDKGKGRKGDLLIWPNPVESDLVSVYFKDGIMEMSILTLTGKEIIHRAYPGDKMIRINTGRMAEGIYLIQVVSSQNEIITGKLVIIS